MFDKLALPRRAVSARRGARWRRRRSRQPPCPPGRSHVSPGLVRPLPTVSGTDIALTIGKVAVRVDGKVSRAVGVNGTVPGPLVRLKEGQKVRLSVTNTLDEESSIHWHGLLVPFAMDGVPGVSFPGIMPRSTFNYEFRCRSVGHLLVSQSLGLSGRGRALRSDRDRSRRCRSGRLRPRARAGAVRPQPDDRRDHLQETEADGRRLFQYAAPDAVRASWPVAT